MSLADQLKPTPAPPCKLARLADTLPTEDQETLATVLEDRVGYSTRRIAKALRAEGHEVSHTAVQQHRDRQCTCYREPRYRGTPQS